MLFKMGHGSKYKEKICLVYIKCNLQIPRFGMSGWRVLQKEVDRQTWLCSYFRTAAEQGVEKTPYRFYAFRELGNHRCFIKYWKYAMAQMD